MSQADLLARLESVTQRLESVARKMGAGGGDEGGVPQYVSDYEAFVRKEVAAAVKATNELGIGKVGELLNDGFAQVLDLLKKLPNAKKPSQKELMEYLKPCSDAIAGLDNLRYRAKDFKKFGDHYKAAFEMLNSLQWVMIAPPNGVPVGHCDAQLQATDFNLNRVLKDNKDAATKAFVQAYKAINANQKKFVKEYFATGLTWNPKGSELSGAAAAAPSAKEEAKEQPKAAAKTGGGGGMAGVFGQLNKGTGITKGLKKVKDSQKTKYRKDRSGKVSSKPAPKKKTRKKGAASLNFRGGRWMAENYDEGVFEIDKADLKSNVYITMCDNSVFQIPNKVKSVTIDSCIKCRVFVQEVISTVEMVNCKSTTIIVQQKAPSLSIDKSQSPRIILLRPAYDAKPDIYTSGVSAMNVEIPGKTDEDDTIEIPIPEQFLTQINDGKAQTTEVKHG